MTIRGDREVGGEGGLEWRDSVTVYIFLKALKAVSGQGTGQNISFCVYYFVLCVHFVNLAKLFLIFLLCLANLSEELSNETSRRHRSYVVLLKPLVHFIHV